MQIKPIIKKYIYLPFFLFLVGITAVGPSPMFHPAPHRDSGIYLYLGKMLALGQTPYVDFWDHKGPIIFFINALAYFLKPNSVWGIWLIDVLFIFLAAIFSYKLLEKLFGNTTAFLATSLWIIYFSLNHSINYSENYYLVIQMAVLYFFIKAKEEKKESFYFVVGALGAIGFLIRANLIGAIIAVLLYLVGSGLVQKNYKKMLLQISKIGIGSVIVFSIISIYLIQNIAFFDFIDQAFIFNFNYSSLAEGSVLTFAEKFNNLIGFVFPFSLAGWVAIGLWLYFQIEPLPENIKTGMVLSLLLFPLELFLAAVSGRYFTHYYVPWFGVFGLLSGFLIFLFIQYLPKNTFSRFNLKLNYVIVISMVFCFSFFPLLENYIPVYTATEYFLRKNQVLYVGYDEDTREILDYISNTTAPGDTLYLWGNELVYNYLTDRNAPSKFTNHLTFEYDDYMSQNDINDFIQSLLIQKPIIIDTSPEERHLPALFGEPTGKVAVDQFQEFMRENYEEVHRFSSNGWIVYEKMD